MFIAIHEGLSRRASQITFPPAPPARAGTLRCAQRDTELPLPNAGRRPRPAPDVSRTRPPRPRHYSTLNFGTQHSSGSSPAARTPSVRSPAPLTHGIPCAERGAPCDPLATRHPGKHPMPPPRPSDLDLGLLFEQLPDAALVADLGRNRIVFWNRPAAHLL